jgi:hypothetical protein
MKGGGYLRAMTRVFKQAVTDFFAAASRRSRLKTGIPGRNSPKGVRGFEGSPGAIIRLLEECRPPATPVEQLAINVLKREGRTSFTKLLEHVARELYSDEVRSGAWALDIGLYGPNLFVPDVVSELKSGDGILWKIEEPEGQRDGILSDLS